MNSTILTNSNVASLRCDFAAGVARSSAYRDHCADVHCKPRRAAPFWILVVHGGKKGLILLDQIRTVDITRLVTKFGVVGKTTLAATLGTLQEVFSE